MVRNLLLSYEKNYGEDGLIELARRSAESGVFFRTPVFDGADFETDIQPLLKNLDMSENGAFKIT